MRVKRKRPPIPLDWVNLHGIIYIIENTINGKRYIGQTINTFAKRYYPFGEWWKRTESPVLAEEVKQYGADSFRVSIVEHGKTRAELDILEETYANQLNTYYPNGYNIKRCGHHQYVTKVPKLLSVPPGVLRSPTGEIHEVTDWIDFCDKHGLCKTAIWKLATGKSRFQLGWTLADNPKTTPTRWGEFVLYDESGNRYEVDNLSRFCRDRKLDYGCMRMVVDGRSHASHGFALSLDAFARRKKRYIVTLTHIDGREVILTNVQKQCRAIGLHPRFVYDLKNGKLQSYIGWKLKHVEAVLIAP